MRTIKQYLEAAKARKENGEEGFSLVELIVVVVILGILAAVAIPIFNGIQANAEKSASEAAAANFASEAAAALAAPNGTAPTPPAVSADQPYTFAYVNGTPTKVDAVCVTAKKGDNPVSTKKGPGCGTGGSGSGTGGSGSGTAAG